MYVISKSFKIQCCEVLWAIKDNSIISTFIDAGASRFLLPHMLCVEAKEDPLVKRAKYTVDKGQLTLFKDLIINITLMLLQII